MELAQEQMLPPQPVDDPVIEREARAGDENPPPIKVEVASAVAAATTAAAAPSADAAEALRIFRSSLLDMVGVPERYSDTGSGTGKEKRIGWLGRSAAADDLSCASLIAKYVSLWSVLERPENQKFSVQAVIGLQMLQGQSYAGASKVFNEIEFQTSTPAALSYVMKGVGIFLMGFFAVSMVIVATLLSLGSILDSAQELALATWVSSLDPQWVNVVVACIAGMFGSVVSLLLRISEFESTRGRSQMFLKLTGATLPIVGGIFGAFVASLFCAQIVNISIGENGFSVWAFLVIGFLSGFSERFSRTFVQLAEKKFGGAEQPQVSIAANATVSETEPGARSRRPAQARRKAPARRASARTGP